MKRITETWSVDDETLCPPLLPSKKSITYLRTRPQDNKNMILMIITLLINVKTKTIVGILTILIRIITS